MEKLNTIRTALQGKKTYFAVAIGCLYLVGVWAGFWEWNETVLAFFGLSGLAFLRSAVTRVPPGPVLVLLLSLIFLAGCVKIQPGADAFVVQVERTQQSAAASFDLVLAVDDVDRPFWRTNAPGFHGFCEWLRQPITYASPEYGPTNVARALMIQFQVDDLKGAYVQGKGSSNALWGALQVLDQALVKAREWETVIVQEGAKDARAN